MFLNVLEACITMTKTTASCANPFGMPEGQGEGRTRRALGGGVMGGSAQQGTYRLCAGSPAHSVELLSRPEMGAQDSEFDETRLPAPA